MKIAVSIALGAILLLQLGCGDSGSEGSTERSTAAATPKALEESVPAYAGDWAGLKKVAGRYSGRLLIPKGPSPDQVVIRDLKKGTGPAIQPGDSFVSHYVSFSYENGRSFEPYWGESAGSLIWGTGDRVQGWESGLKGIRAGGIRELIVPASLAYGNAVLVYVVAVDKIEPN